MEFRSSPSGKLVVEFVPLMGTVVPHGFVTNIGSRPPQLGDYFRYAEITLGDRVYNVSSVRVRYAHVLVWEFESAEARDTHDMAYATLVGGIRTNFELEIIPRRSAKYIGYQAAKSGEWIDLESAKELLED